MTRWTLIRFLCAGSLVALLLWSLWDAFAPDPCQYVDGAWNRSGCETAPPSTGGVP